MSEPAAGRPGGDRTGLGVLVAGMAAGRAGRARALVGGGRTAGARRGTGHRTGAVAGRGGPRPNAVGDRPGQPATVVHDEFLDHEFYDARPRGREAGPTAMPPDQDARHDARGAGRRCRSTRRDGRTASRSSPAGGRLPTGPSTTRHGHCSESTRRCRTPGRWSRTAVAADAADEAALAGGPGAVQRGGRCAGRPAGVHRNAARASRRAALGDRRGRACRAARIALTDAVSGALLALTDLPEMRRVGTCGARRCRRDPARCDARPHRPARAGPARTDRRLPALGAAGPLGPRPDRRCRFPGCRRRVPRGGELDHDRPYPLGPTSAANLAGYCTGHHRGKHQAPAGGMRWPRTAPSP